MAIRQLLNQLRVSYLNRSFSVGYYSPGFERGISGVCPSSWLHDSVLSSSPILIDSFVFVQNYSYDYCNRSTYGFYPNLCYPDVKRFGYRLYLVSSSVRPYNMTFYRDSSSYPCFMSTHDYFKLFF